MADADSMAGQLPVSRSQAKALGLTRYFTGKPCKYGHVAERLTSNGFCNACQRIKDARTYWSDVDGAREKDAAYRAAHPERKHIRRERRHAADGALQQRVELRVAVRNARRDAQRSGAQTYENPRPCSACGTNQRYTKTARCVECNRANCRQHKADPTNREYYRRAEREWREKNPERQAAMQINYKHKRRAQEATGVTSRELDEWRRAQRKVCYWCGRKCERAFTVDHYIPLAKGGRHEISNLVIACRTCNCRKHTKDPEEFRAEVWPGTLFAMSATSR